MGNGSDVGKLWLILGTMVSLTSAKQNIHVGVHQLEVSRCVSLPFLIWHSARLCPLLSFITAEASAEQIKPPPWGPAQSAAVRGFVESPSDHQALCQQCSSSWPSGFQMAVIPDILVAFLTSQSIVFHSSYPKGPNFSAFGPPAFPLPPIFSATNVINVLSNLFCWNCDYAQGIVKLFTVITGKRLGVYELCMWSEMQSGP